MDLVLIAAAAVEAVLIIVVTGQAGSGDHDGGAS